MAYTTIDDPTAYFQTVLYTGNGQARSITFDGNTDMQPDWVWGKIRSQSYSHRSFDSVRGAGKGLHNDTNEAEFTQIQNVSSFNSNGFSLGTDNGMNSNGDTHVAWCWKAGTSFTNDASSTGIGDIDSDGSVSATAGFSIAKFTTTGSSVQTVAHGLGSIPDMYIVKGRANGTSWFVYHKDIGNTHYLKLNASEAKTDNPMWGDTSPTSTVFSINPDNFGATTSIGYFFKSIKGYSKFGSYTGNGQSSEGTFVYTGFKPSFIIRKNIDGGVTESWIMQDNKRNTFNVVDKWLEANANVAEDTAYQTDFLSNGFKMRSNNDGTNRSATNYIYMAFAENPFTTSSGIPACAR